MRERNPGLLIPVLILVQALVSTPALATDQYAERTGEGCIFCHRESSGGQLNTTGLAYIKSGYTYPIPEGALNKARSLQTPYHKALRFIAGYLHLLAAMVFFGTIFYIHIFVGPRRFRGGIPRAERLLGLSCMAVLTGTGIYLTWIRISAWRQFFNNTFGLMLFIKIVLFALMAAIGVVAVTWIHHRMGREAENREKPAPTGEITSSSLADFDGSEGRRAYIAHKGQVYDVTQSPRWENGRHYGKHSSGTDLTGALEGAPHGPEVLDRVRSVGALSQTEGPGEPTLPAHRVFVIMAYVNLAIIFLILACISVWRWGFPLKFFP